MISFIMLPVSAFATARTPDKLFYKGKERALFANPLEVFYEGKTRPKFFIAPGTISSGCWRGYIAIWKVEDGSLFLIGINSWVCTGLTRESCQKADLRELFGDKLIDGKVKADWYSGELKIPDGEQLKYVHMGYGSVYEREIVLQVEKGKVAGEEMIDNTKRQFPSEMELQRRELEKMRPQKKDNR